MRNILFAATCALALGSISSAALADDWTDSVPVTISGDVGHLKGQGFDETSFGLSGSALFALGWDNLSLQVNGDYAFDLRNSQTAHVGAPGVGFVWAGQDLRLAASAEYQMIPGYEIWSYGVGAEWFATPWLAASLRGGGLKMTPFGDGGGYVGGQLKGYVCPDFALSGGVDYLDLYYHETDYSLKAEYQVWGDVGINLNYTFTSIPNYAGFHVIGIGATVYLNGDAPLIEHERNGTADYITTFAPTFLRYRSF